VPHKKARKKVLDTPPEGKNDVNQKDQNGPIVQRDAKGRWLTGTPSPSPGRPISGRQRISERLLTDLAEVWEEHGKVVLTKLAVSDPGKLTQIAYGLLPRDIFVQVQSNAGPGNLDADSWATMRRVLDLIEQHAPPGSDAASVFETIENALRAEHATLIEG
jgi:hypothetical protein